MTISVFRGSAFGFIVAAILAGCGGVSMSPQATPELPPTVQSSSGYAESVLYSFCTSFAIYCAGGAYPSGNLIFAGHTFYGTTSQGGTNGYGTVYSLTPSGGSCCETVLYSFAGGTADGANPAGIVMDRTGAIYGTTLAGGYDNCGYYQGETGCGTVFALSPTSSGYAQRTIYSFCAAGKSPYCTDGAIPAAGLALKSGVLYGTTQYGGAHGMGAVFSLTKSQSGYTEHVLYSFKGGKDGTNPTALPVFDAKGAMYGTTVAGGIDKCSYLRNAPGCGTIYKLTPSGSGYAERIIYHFRGRRDGANPMAGLTVNRNVLYGTATYGGTQRMGVIFSLAPAQKGYSERVLYAFTGHRDGTYPYAGLAIDKNSNLYGTTFEGGSNGRGVVFELTLTDSGYYEQPLYSFLGGCDGRNPVATPIVDANAHRIYGTTLKGGLCGYGYYGYGTVYRLKR